MKLRNTTDESAALETSTIDDLPSCSFPFVNARPTRDYHRGDYTETLRHNLLFETCHRRVVALDGKSMYLAFDALLEVIELDQLQCREGRGSCWLPNKRVCDIAGI